MAKTGRISWLLGQNECSVILTSTPLQSNIPNANNKRNQMNNFFAHIGMHKTGTTFIQENLVNNADNLLKHSLVYAEWGKGPGHSDIGEQVGKSNSNTHLLDYAKRCEAKHKNCNVILSTEVLCTKSLKVLELELFNASQEYNVHIIITNRNSFDLLKSLFQEQLKWGHKLDFRSIGDWLKILNSNDLSLQYLKGLCDLIIRNNYILHSFKITKEDPVDMAIDKFMKIIEVPSQSLELKSNYVNSSLTPLNQVILSQINSLVPKGGKKRITKRMRGELANQMTLLSKRKNTEEKNLKLIIQYLC